ITELFLKQKKTRCLFFSWDILFGGKVSTLLAKEKDTLILLSSAGILAKNYLVRFKIRIFKILKLFGLGKFYRYFASKDGVNLSPMMYETFKKVVDEDF
ncbi:alpha/beta hydrolase, partial [Campylobacter jejuni]|nr:alpha/beta hydrolase [Campylobacter jejuni]